MISGPSFQQTQIKGPLGCHPKLLKGQLLVRQLAIHIPAEDLGHLLPDRLDFLPVAAARGMSAIPNPVNLQGLVISMAPNPGNL